MGVLLAHAKTLFVLLIMETLIMIVVFRLSLAAQPIPALLLAVMPTVLGMKVRERVDSEVYILLINFCYLTLQRRKRLHFGREFTEAKI